MRRAAVLALAVALAGCGSPDLERSDVADVVRDAFAAAGATATDVEVADEADGGRWAARADVDGRPLSVEVDADAGRIVSVDFGAEVNALSEAQLEDVAAYADNPAADRARTRRLLVGVVALAGVVAGGLAFARRLRLREEAEAEFSG